MINFVTKSFQQLSLDELYRILGLRNEVFILEQNCFYQDIDSKDQKALHVMGYIGTEMVAYARLFKPNDYFEQASIGRVLVKQSVRGKLLGYVLMNRCIQDIKQHYQTTTIEISAQEYLKQFYQNLGFTPISESYLEDKIPHVRMLKRYL